MTFYMFITGESFRFIYVYGIFYLQAFCHPSCTSIINPVMNHERGKVNRITTKLYCKTQYLQRHYSHSYTSYWVICLFQIIHVNVIMDGNGRWHNTNVSGIVNVHIVSYHIFLSLFHSMDMLSTLVVGV